MQITDNHFNILELPPATRLSVCSICQRFQIPIDAKREELTATMVYRVNEIIVQRANTRVPETDRPWCTSCRREYYDLKKAEQSNGEAA